MKKSLPVFVLFLFCLLASCTKREDAILFTGTCFTWMNHEPVKGATVEVYAYQSSTSWLFNNDQSVLVGRAKTDENGFYKINPRVSKLSNDCEDCGYYMELIAPKGYIHNQQRIFLPFNNQDTVYTADIVHDFPLGQSAYLEITFNAFSATDNNFRMSMLSGNNNASIGGYHTMISSEPKSENRVNAGDYYFGKIIGGKAIFEVLGDDSSQVYMNTSSADGTIKNHIYRNVFCPKSTTTKITIDY